MRKHDSIGFQNVSMLCQSPGAPQIVMRKGRCSVVRNSHNGVVLMSMILGPGGMNIGLPWAALRGERRDEVNLHLHIHSEQNSLDL